jgi:membrane-associated PAP2 superfamily phosphatase
MQSKKFKAWLISQLLLAAMAITALVKQPNLDWPLSSFMVAIVFGMISITMWYLGKQAAVDSAVRGFAMVGKVAGLAGTAIEAVKPKPSE